MRVYHTANQKHTLIPTGSPAYRRSRQQNASEIEIAVGKLSPKVAYFLTGVVSRMNTLSVMCGHENKAV